MRGQIFTAYLGKSEPGITLEDQGCFLDSDGSLRYNSATLRPGL
jgi:hypothetical protein